LSSTEKEVGKILDCRALNRRGGKDFRRGWQVNKGFIKKKRKGSKKKVIHFLVPQEALGPCMTPKPQALRGKRPRKTFFTLQGGAKVDKTGRSRGKEGGRSPTAFDNAIGGFTKLHKEAIISGFLRQKDNGFRPSTLDTGGQT